MDDRIILGSIESVFVPDFSREIVAKVDTGAWSGALHCTDIHEKDGVLYFTPMGDQSLTRHTTEYKRRIVRSAHGHSTERYIIPLTIVVKGKQYQAEIGLSNRMLMTREMLIGRKFLLENNMLVDVSLTKENDQEAEVLL